MENKDESWFNTCAAVWKSRKLCMLCGNPEEGIEKKLIPVCGPCGVKINEEHKKRKAEYDRIMHEIEEDMIL